MEWIRKQLPRLRGAIAVHRNQREILLNAANNNQILLVSPGGVGTIEHFYHFVFDLLIPLYRLKRNAPSNVEFLIEEFGVLTLLLQQVLPAHTKIVTRREAMKITNKTTLLGMNPHGVYVSKAEISRFRKAIFQALKINQSPSGSKVVLFVERLPSDRYYLEAAEYKGSGAERRSIPNHPELLEHLKKSLSGSSKLLNIQPERLDFKEQIRYFATADTVIAQHGAALANTIWMKPGSQIIELNHSLDLDHFKTISQMTGHRYRMFKTDHEHAIVDPTRFSNWLTKTGGL